MSKSQALVYFSQLSDCLSDERMLVSDLFAPVEKVRASLVVNGLFSRLFGFTSARVLIASNAAVELVE